MSKSRSNIGIAFILNFVFTIIELVGGIFTNSIAILSDSFHDFGDCLSIGLSYILEKKAEKKADKNYTFGYARVRILSALITSAVLLVGSAFVIYESIQRFINPEPTKGMWIFIISIFGIVLNGLAVFKTSKSKNVNEKAINLHIWEDVLGWIVVFIGSIFIWAFNIHWLDSVMSLGIAIYLIIHVIMNIKEVFDIFLEKKPSEINTDEIQKHLENVPNVLAVHHIHAWALDSEIVLMSCHIVVDDNLSNNDIILLKKNIREEAKEHKIAEMIIETEFQSESCKDGDCHCTENVVHEEGGHHHNHHH